MSVYILDTECTDLSEDREPIEIAWFEVPDDWITRGEPGLVDVARQAAISRLWSQRFKPERPISHGAMAVHHILPRELEGEEPPSAFRLPNDCEIIIGHSVDFDWEAIGRPDVLRIDTHALAQWTWPDASGYSQSALLYMLLGETPETRNMLRDAHAAHIDVWHNFILLTHILAVVRETHGIDTWRKLWEHSDECRIPRTCPMKRYEGVPLDELDGGFIGWCLNQPWLDPYFRKGLERVYEDRMQAYCDKREDDAYPDDDFIDDDQGELPF